MLLYGAILVSAIAHVESIRVCKSFGDYFLFSINPKCYDNPAGENNITENIISWGYKAEEHIVETEDGYRILVERAYGQITKETPIILAHGVMMNGLGFTLRANKSLAHVLATLGYDVWIINFRGAKYSLGHRNLSHFQYAFWDFSFDEMIEGDAKAVFDLVLKTTGRKAVCIGFSMGNQVCMGYGSIYPEDTKAKLKGIVALAPVPYFKGSRTIAKLLIPFMPIIMAVDRLIFGGNLFQLIPILSPLCSIDTVTMYFCQGLLSPVFGPDWAQMDPETYPIFIKKDPDTIGTKLLNHLFQLGQSGKFQKYDYGAIKNLLKYNQLNPPIYNITKIPVPVSLWRGNNDYMATEITSNLINEELLDANKCKINVISYANWNHLDFTEAKDIQSLLYNNLLPEIAKLEQGDCTRE